MKCRRNYEKPEAELIILHFENDFLTGSNGFTSDYTEKFNSDDDEETL